MVLALSNEGDIVLDCFLGSGTTSVSALKHKRNFMGTEQNFEYIEISEKRLEKVEPLIFGEKITKKRKKNYICINITSKWK